MRHSIEELRLAFNYDPISGTLARKLAKRYDHMGRRVSKRNEIAYDNVKYPLSHLVWALYYGYWPAELIDHRDGDHSNIKLNNLREATHRQNQYNKVGFGAYPKGVVYKRDAKRSKPWSARIRINGRKVAIGSYATMEEAAEAYRNVAELIQGEFALHNSMKEQD